MVTLLGEQSLQIFFGSEGRTLLVQAKPNQGRDL